ncbi:MAG: hypothetical protein P8Z00_18890 [Anaerolineales bacterium]|jgi:hypothetical protein
MSTLSKIQTDQGKLEALTRKWWFYLLLLLLFFLPSQTSREFDPRQSMDLVGQVLANPLIYAIPALMPVAKLIMAGLIAGILLFGNRLRRAFDVYLAILYIAMAFFQTMAITETYGLAVITGNLALVLVVGLFWIWEAMVKRNDFAHRKRPWWAWWVAPLAALALLAPVDASTMSPDFSLIGMLSNEAGLTFCMMTPIVLAVLAVFYPTVNLAVLRVTSFVGMLLGAVNMIVWFVVEPWGWWMGVMHVPLILLSVYGFVLGQRKSPQATRIPAM